jgi:rhamnulokinase
MAGFVEAHEDVRALIAIDLGAESCRVSLLRWFEGLPHITLVHRFPNAPRFIEGGLRWDLAMIEAGLNRGLRECASIATEGIRSIAVDGWAVDYVRLDANGVAIADPYCYRDERTIESEKVLHRKIGRERIRELTGVQLLRINTLYQLHADSLAQAEPTPWVNLPEYVLTRLGGAQVAEITNATHSQLVGVQTREWCEELFRAAGADIACAPALVRPGTIVGKVSGALSEHPAFRDTLLIAPACHDTASAIAGIPADGDDWAYISSGTWSLVGTLIDRPLNNPAVNAANFTNLAGVGGRTLFHKNVNGMWLLQQCIEQWKGQGMDWTVPELVQAAERVSQPPGLLDVDDPELMFAGGMTARINSQRQAVGLTPLDESTENAPAFASLIFHSLAARYAAVLGLVARHTGKNIKRLYIVGGGSRNNFLNQLTEQATGIPVLRGATESSTLGNFSVQLAVLGRMPGEAHGVSCAEVCSCAKYLFERAKFSDVPSSDA